MNRDIVLDRNADCINTDELAKYLLGRLDELTAEYQELDADDSFKDYINGIMAGFNTVLIKIGCPSNLIPDYEDN